jgi:hypothetical protein
MKPIGKVKGNMETLATVPIENMSNFRLTLSAGSNTRIWTTRGWAHDLRLKLQVKVHVTSSIFVQRQSRNIIPLENRASEGNRDELHGVKE